MADKKADTVSVTTSKYHTHDGQEHHEGDVYEVAADQVANLQAQGMAHPTEPPAEKEAKPAKASQPVEPMTTEDMNVKPKPHAAEKAPVKKH